MKKRVNYKWCNKVSQMHIWTKLEFYVLLKQPMEKFSSLFYHAVGGSVINFNCIFSSFNLRDLREDLLKLDLR